MARDLHELSRLEDSLSYLYVEKAVVERDENSLIILREGERIPLPVSSLSVLLLGPGTNITHAAIQVAADSGCMVVWCGEGALRFYGYGMGETRSAERMLRQAAYCMDEEKHMQVVRRMFQLRFPDMNLEGLSLNQIRGMEGVRVREAYKLLARKYHMKWSGRNYSLTDWDDSDDLNKALSMANVCLYGLCNAAIVSLGYSPALGFVHTGKMQSFVYDIADLYKLETSAPAAFEVTCEPRCEGISRETRIVMRRMLRERGILKRIAKDLAYLFDEAGECDQNREDAGELWNEHGGTTAGGRNHAEEV